MEMYDAGTSELLIAPRWPCPEAQLSLTEAPGKWSIREHALHLIDLGISHDPQSEICS